MPVHYKDQLTGDTCAIIPAPFVSINKDHLKGARGGKGDYANYGINIGSTFRITLTGTLVAFKGSPVGRKDASDHFTWVPDASASVSLGGPYGDFYTGSTANGTQPSDQSVPSSQRLTSILRKQEALRELFKDGGTLELVPVDGDYAVVCNPRVLSINFAEGNWYDRCDYVVELEADTMRCDGIPDRHKDSDPLSNFVLGISAEDLESTILEREQIYLDSFSEDWSLEEDTAEVESPDYAHRTFRITHNVTATGKSHFNSTGNLVKPAWEQAKEAVRYVINNPSKDYPNATSTVPAGANFLDLAAGYNGYNHTKVENIGESDGTYSVTETWILATVGALEDFQLSVRATLGTPHTTISMDGTIKGLESKDPSVLAASGDYPLPVYDGVGNVYNSTPIGSKFFNAEAKFNDLTNYGTFNIASKVYARVNSAIQQTLNTTPLSLSIGVNKAAGEITYAVEYDTRPSNLVTGAVSEEISINDTYPGDVFASIPVLGRKTGPVLQYVGTRTEYRRSLSIDLVMGSNYVYKPNTNLFTPEVNTLSYIATKPSLTNPQSAQIKSIIDGASPKNETGIEKWLVSPSPAETWNPKTGSWNFNIEWVYELSQ